MRMHRDLILIVVLFAWFRPDINAWQALSMRDARARSFEQNLQQASALLKEAALMAFRIGVAL